MTEKNMLLGGVQKLTLIDYPGKVAATVFTVGCNFRCAFCHNPELVDPELIKENPKISERDFFDFLKSRQGDLEGVCITGGEPTLHLDLPEFIKKIKKLGFAVKLDTNGSNPEMLKKLIIVGVDYIAMDIKAPLEKYKEITGVENLDNIKKSVEIIKNSCLVGRQAGLDYEFRTTVLPKFHNEEDLMKIAQWMKGSKKYFLQQFYPTKTLDGELKNEKAYSTEKLKELCQKIKPYFEHCEVRG